MKDHQVAFLMLYTWGCGLLTGFNYPTAQAAQTELDIKATVVPAIILDTADGPCVYCPDCNGPITQGPIPECTREQVEAYYYE